MLVTGGAGFIGSNFVHYWCAAYPADRIVVLDALTYAGNQRNFDGLDSTAYRFVHGDIANRALVESLLRDEHLDTVVNFAAETHVDRSISGPEAFVQTNILGTHALLAACRQEWLLREPRPHRFHQVSTDEVYGSLASDDAPRKEDDAYRPNSPYAASKAAADHLVRAYHETYGLDATIGRCCNNYGPRQFPEKLIPKALVRLLRGEPMPVYGDGRQRRDWLDVRDHCLGIDRVLKSGLGGETYNFAAHCEIDNITMLERLCELVDRAFASEDELVGRFPEAAPVRGLPSRSCLQFVTDRPGHDRRYALDVTRARSLGFVAQRDLSRGLQATLDWYLANEAWWRGGDTGR